MLLSLLCLSASLPRRPAIRARSSTPPSSSSCDLCALLASALEPMALSGSDELSSVSRLRQICDILDPSAYPACGAIVAVYGEALFKSIQSGASLSAACAALPLCARAPAGPDREPPNETTCDICVRFTKYVAVLLEKNISGQEFYDDIDGYCKTYHYPNVVFCNALETVFLPTIVSELQAGMDPRDICNGIGFCYMAADRPGRKSARKEDSVICGFCRELTVVVAQLRAGRKAEEEIGDYLQGWCSEIGGAVGGVCKGIAEQYAPIIGELLDEGIEELGVCQRIGLCEGVVGAQRG